MATPPPFQRRPSNTNGTPQPPASPTPNQSRPQSPALLPLPRESSVRVRRSTVSNGSRLRSSTISNPGGVVGVGGGEVGSGGGSLKRRSGLSRTGIRDVFDQPPTTATTDSATGGEAAGPLPSPPPVVGGVNQLTPSIEVSGVEDPLLVPRLTEPDGNVVGGAHPHARFALVDGDGGATNGVVGGRPALPIRSESLTVPTTNDTPSDQHTRIRSSTVTSRSTVGSSSLSPSNSISSATGSGGRRARSSTISQRLFQDFAVEQEKKVGIYVPPAPDSTPSSTRSRAGSNAATADGLQAGSDGRRRGASISYAGISYPPNISTSSRPSTPASPSSLSSLGGGAGSGSNRMKKRSTLASLVDQDEVEDEDDSKAGNVGGGGMGGRKVVWKPASAMFSPEVPSLGRGDSEGATTGTKKRRSTISSAFAPFGGILSSSPSPLSSPQGSINRPSSAGGRQLQTIPSEGKSSTTEGREREEEMIELRDELGQDVKDRDTVGQSVDVVFNTNNNNNNNGGNLGRNRSSTLGSGRRPRSGTRTSVLASSSLGRSSTGGPLVGGEDDEEEHHEAHEVDLLEVVDPTVATTAHLANIQNAICFPNLPFFSRAPVISLDSPTPPEKQSEKPSSPTSPSSLEEVELEEGSSESDHPADLLDAHVENAVKNGKKDKFRKIMKGVWLFLKTPLGVFVAIYGFLVVFWGAGLVLILIGAIKMSSENHDIWVEICSQILNGLFTITGVGLIPQRSFDTYRILVISHYARLTRKRRQLQGLKELKDKNDLPDTEVDLEKGMKRDAVANGVANGDGDKKVANGGVEGTELKGEVGREDDGTTLEDGTQAGTIPRSFPSTVGHEGGETEFQEGEEEEVTATDEDKEKIDSREEDMPEMSVLSEKEEARLRKNQITFGKSQTWYRAHASPTHHAFPISWALAICFLNDGNSFFQCILCGVMWGLNRHTRPAWTTGCLIPFSFLCGIAAGIMIWQGGERTKKTKQVKQKVMQIIAEEKELRREEEEAAAAAEVAEEEGRLRLLDTQERSEFGVLEKK